MTEAEGHARGRGRVALVTAGAGVLVLVLALAALFWPGGSGRDGQGMFLVFDCSGIDTRPDAVFEPLALFMEEVTGRPLDLVVTGTREEFRAAVGRGPDLVLCPDGLAVGLDADAFRPLVVGRRAAPQNLRPRGVLVYRKSAGPVEQPWRRHPGRTVFGDSLTLASTGVWRRTGPAAVPAPGSRSGCRWGPDPYDHAPVLHAARLGAFDFAVVRQWDADRFFTGGLLSPLEWGVEPLTVPVPDVVLLAGRGWDRGARLALADRLAVVGRRTEGEGPAAARLGQALSRIGLAGFNLLVEPDFDLVRRSFVPDWLPGVE